MGEKAGSLRQLSWNLLEIYSDPSMAVAGEHTRTIQIATPTIGGLMKFAIKTVTCLGCKTPLRSNKGKRPLSPFAACGLKNLETARSASIADRNCQSCTRNRWVRQNRIKTFD